MDRRLVLLMVLVAAVAVAGCTSGDGPTYDNSGDSNTPAADQQSGQADDTDSGGNEPPAVNFVLGGTPDRTIRLTNNQFSATEFSISSGSVVRFVNDEGEHTVTIEGEGIDSTLEPGDRVTLRFNEGGTYQVYCRFHGSPGSGMHTTVQVE